MNVILVFQYSIGPEASDVVGPFPSEDAARDWLEECRGRRYPEGWTVAPLITPEEATLEFNRRT